MKIIKKIFLAAVCFASFFLASCMSMQQDILLVNEDINDGGFSREIESRLVRIDADFYLGKKAEENSGARSVIISEIDDKLKSGHMEKMVQTKLLAMKGIVHFLGGEKGSAKKCLSEAQKNYSNDVHVMILSRRLKEISTQELSKNILENNSLLTLESAIENFEKANYADSVGLFDTAFLTLDPFYKNAYQELRDKAWQLKDAKGTDSALMGLNEINFSQMFLLTQENSSLLNSYTAGKKLNAKKIVSAVEGSSLMDYPNGEKFKIENSALVTRIHASRFLWNLFCTIKKPGTNRTKYSEKYKARSNPKSPVDDVSLDNPDFDCVLGTVENEIMQLKNGKNFMPDENISAGDFVQSLNLLDAQ